MKYNVGDDYAVSERMTEFLTKMSDLCSEYMIDITPMIGTVEGGSIFGITVTSFDHDGETVFLKPPTGEGISEKEAAEEYRFILHYDGDDCDPITTGAYFVGVDVKSGKIDQVVKITHG